MATSRHSQNGNRVRFDVLGQLCLEKRTRDGLSIRDAERVTGISASTLSRIENGKTAETQHVVILTRWLEVDVARFIGSYTENLPRAVKAMLLTDPKIGKDEADALAATFSSLYRQMIKS